MRRIDQANRLRAEFPPEFTIGRNVLVYDNLAVFLQIFQGFRNFIGTES